MLRITIFLMMLLLFSSCSAETIDTKAQLLLAKGCIEGDQKMIRTALTEGADINEPWMTNLPLYWAANNNQVEVVKLLLNTGADINGLSGIAKRSALHEAALRGNYEIVKLLIDTGADINIRNAHDRTPLYYVTSPPVPLSKPNNADLIAEYLIAHGGTL